MKYTDEQLRLVLAKMLPDKVFLNIVNYRFYWIDGGAEIQDTEWLHVCWLVDQTLNGKLRYRFDTEIDENTSASWQQRAIALANVKGVSIGP